MKKYIVVILKVMYIGTRVNNGSKIWSRWRLNRTRIKSFYGEFLKRGEPKLNTYRNLSGDSLSVR